MSVYNEENLAKNLPDAYKQTTDSNNFKILEIERIACKDLRDRLKDIDEILDINKATGKTLDLYGERVGQPRGIATDEKYMLMIKAKIMRNLTSGSYESIANSICKTFNCEPSQVFIQDEPEPCTVSLVSLPLSAINQAGLTTSQTVALIKSLLPIGISLKSFLFEGTFEFASNENDYNEEKGFATSEDDQTIGGYFGATSGDEKDEILPI